MAIDEAWHWLVDDAAIFPPGDVPLHEATAAYGARSESEGEEIAGTFVLRDTDLPLVRGFDAPLSVVSTGGAGQLEGPVELCRKLDMAMSGLEVTARDLDDLAGNVRRFIAATDELETECTVFVELPATEPGHGWLAAADVAADNYYRLKFRTGGLHASDFPTSETLASWIDAALDRELQFKCTAGLHRAVRHTGEDGFEHHGFLNVLKATVRAFDGASRDEVVAVLEDRELNTITTEEVDRARQWFLSFGSCSVQEPWDDLCALGFAS